MKTLREAIEAALGDIPPPDEALAQTVQRVKRRERGRRVGTIVASMVIAGAAIGIVWSALAPIGVDDSGPPRSGRPRSIEPRVTARVNVGDLPQAVAAGDGRVWVAVESRSGGENQLVEIDPATDEVTRVIPSADTPRSIVIAGGSLWVAFDDAVRQIDPDDGQVLAEARDPGSLIAATPDAIWSMASADTLARIDPATGRVIAEPSLDLPPGWFITGPIVGGADGLWVMTAHLGGTGGVASARLVRVDPTTNSTVATFDVEAATTFAVGSGSVWVASAYADGRTSLTRIDAGTNETGPPVEITGMWVPFGLGDDRLWLLGGDGGSSELGWSDLIAPGVQGSLRLGSVPAFEGSGLVDPEADVVWVVNLEDTVTKVDIQSAS